MADDVQEDFPLFPLSLVALPGELVPLHIFEERYKTMMSECLEAGTEFGIVWMADDGLREIGCACTIERVLERMEDGRLNLLARGNRPFRVLERQAHLPIRRGSSSLSRTPLTSLTPGCRRRPRRLRRSRPARHRP